MTGTGFANPRVWTWLAIALIAAWLVWLLSPILAPFLAGAIFAYMLNPLVNRLDRYTGRTFAVILVMLLALFVVIAILLLVLPLFYKEAVMMSERLPDFLAWLNAKAAPWILLQFGIAIKFDLETVKQLTAQILQGNEGLVPRVLGSLQIGGLVLLGLMIKFLLVPVVLFYLLRDWNELVARVDHMIPRQRHAQAVGIAREVDAVLAEFLRGQMLVIIVMVCFYSLALWVAGLQFALPVGVITGGLVFIPYVGAFLGFVLGTVAALLQFDDFTGVLFVWLAFGIGQVLEGMAVTPLLVGQRIGLHPVAVLFALLAFGQVFGFFGVLLALPASAVLLVCLRRITRAYRESPLYGGTITSPPPGSGPG